jgi:hypothetical protein
VQHGLNPALKNYGGLRKMLEETRLLLFALVCEKRAEKEGCELLVTLEV